MQLYVPQKGQQAGPFPLATVKEMLQRGELMPADMTWYEGAPGWIPLSSFMAVHEAASAAPPSTSPAPPRVAAPAPQHEAVRRALAGIRGTHGMTPAELQAEVQLGGVFVRYQFCISVLVMSFKRSSPIYFIKAGHSRASQGIAYTLISLFAGWWGIPWGPIWTVSTMTTNFQGGKDITAAVMSALAGRR